MGFKSIKSLQQGKDFNSALSCNFKNMYDKIVLDKYTLQEKHKPSQTFAPSAFRCDRMSFFRLRGVEPDEDVNINPSLSFSAMLGTACHLEFQSNLKSSMSEYWVDVCEYLEEYDLDHEFVVSAKSEFETQLEFLSPPVKFSCDGILKFGDTYYLLEIKTSEYQSFKTLDKPKSQHIDQITCYCALLELEHALVVYQDRLYGDIKCYELNISLQDRYDVFKRMERVIDNVRSNIAPPKLAENDYWCTYCKYKKRCDQWG